MTENYTVSTSNKPHEFSNKAKDQDLHIKVTGTQNQITIKNENKNSEITVNLHGGFNGLNIRGYGSKFYERNGRVQAIYQSYNGQNSFYIHSGMSGFRFGEEKQRFGLNIPTVSEVFIHKDAKLDANSIRFFYQDKLSNWQNTSYQLTGNHTVLLTNNGEKFVVSAEEIERFTATHNKCLALNKKLFGNSPVAKEEKQRAIKNLFDNADKYSMAEKIVTAKDVTSNYQGIYKFGNEFLLISNKTWGQ